MNEFDNTNSLGQNGDPSETPAPQQEGYPISGNEAIEEARRAAAQEEARMREQAAQEAARMAREQQEYNAWLYARQQEQAAREAAEKAAKKKRKKTVLKVTAIVMAVLMVAGLCTYAAGNLISALRDIRTQISYRPETQAPSADPGETVQRGGNRDQESGKTHSGNATVEAGDPSIETAPTVSGNAVPLLTDVSNIVELAMPSMVSINVTALETYNSGFYGSRQREVEGAGSGVIIGDNGTELWIVTNNHVVEDAIKTSVTFIDEESVEAYVKGTDAENDVAVVGVKLSDMKESTKSAIRAIVIGESESLRLGEGVIAIGNALGWGQSVTTGVVSALDRKVDFEDGTVMHLLQVSAAINPGNSGGALLNAKGELIGINNAKYSDTDVEGVGFAIPISSILDVMEELSLRQPREKVSDEDYPYLGVTFQNLSSQYMQLYGMPSGAFVADVGEDTPAAKAGILKYDIITGLEGVKVSDYDSLVAELQYHSGGEEVTVKLMRLEGGKYVEKEITVTLGFKKDYQ